MSTKAEILNILKENTYRFVSGQELADTIGVSRNSIWKAVNSLVEQGYQIKSLPSTGYKLTESTDILSKDIILENCRFPFIIEVLDVVDSTNSYAKKLEPKNVRLTVANEQTAGRGRLGRNFFSPSGTGLYLTISMVPNFGLDKALLITSAAAVAVSRAIEETTGLNPKIKWVNDIYIGGKKVAGILTEAETDFETGNISSLHIGIGVNCFEAKIPEELVDIVSYLEAPKKEFTRNELCASIANNFMDAIRDIIISGNAGRVMKEYKMRSLILGEPILIFNQAVAREIGRTEDRLEEGIRARAIDIDENGGLVVEFQEGRLTRQMKTLSTGEVTIRKVVR